MTKKLTLLLLLLALLGSSALAQRAFQLRLGLPAASVGIGLESAFERNVVANFYGDAVLNGPSFLLGGEVQFKPDLGQFDRDFRGIRPYFGGGVGLFVGGNNPAIGISLSAGVEFALDAEAGLFLGGQSFFGNIRADRFLLGASFR
ncbi:MAG: hypothetical protein SFU83_24595 [Meiothermus sp.]|nr:hypothetical protein [Meiothermus sp.]